MRSPLTARWPASARASTVTTGGVANPFVSIVEDVLTVGGIVLSVALPWVAASIVVIAHRLAVSDRAPIIVNDAAPQDGARSPPRTNALRPYGNVYTPHRRRTRHACRRSRDTSRRASTPKKGDIVFTFYPHEARQHSAAFIKLARAGFYDG